MRTLACLLFAALTLSACGKKGPLIYPDMLLPAAPSDVTAQQSGSNVRLAFSIPTKDRSGRPLEDVAGVKILKKDSLTGQDPGCSSCTTDFSLFKKWYADIPDDSQRYGNRVVFLDGTVRSGRSYTYTVTAFTQDNLDGAVSAAVTTDLVQPPPPPVLRATSHPTEIILEFIGLPLEGPFMGYSLYRSVKGEPFSYLPHIAAPLAVNSFTDVGMDRDVTYVYAVRTVVRRSSGVLVEGGLSNQVEAKLKDGE